LKYGFDTKNILKMKKLLIATIGISLVLMSCNSGNSGNKGSDITITAAGATFPMPFYNLAFKKYGEISGITFNYGGIGSGGGIRSLADRVVDFGATDAYLSEKEMSDLPADIVHIPTCLGAVVIAYNLPGVDELRLTPELLEKIFMGTITAWNDPAIAAVNGQANLPATKITVVYRSDGSGTTYIFSDYLSKTGNAWKDKIGKGKSLNWPTGIGAKGNPGVAGTISQSAGTIGYIGSEYAFSQKISYALIQNSSGNFITPDLKSVSAAARMEIPSDTRVMVTNSSDPDAYPISGFTWIILYKEQAYNKRSVNRIDESIKFIDWLLGEEGQSVAESVNYAPLTDEVSSAARQILNSITFEGKPVKETLPQ
jgi:phosphate transport system substrate-binding protein